MADVSRRNIEPYLETTKLGQKQSSESLDKAALYLHNHAQSFGERSVNSRELLHKIDWKIIPIAFACYTMQFLDRANINVGVVLFISGFEANFCTIVCGCYGAT